MFKLNNSIVPNKVHIGWHFSSYKYAYRDSYSALKSNVLILKLSHHQCTHENVLGPRYVETSHQKGGNKL